MENDGAGCERSNEERAALIAKARAWEGTQREFAAAFGVNQSTVSKWRNAAGPRSYTPADRAAVVASFASFDGPQRAFDDALGLPRGTTGKWVCLAKRGGGRRARPPLRRVERLAAPAFLEVVPACVAETSVVAPPSPAPARETPPRTVSMRLALPGGAELQFDTLPPAGWVAELAKELGRC